MIPAKRKILSDLLFRFQAVRRSKNNKYILLNAPNENLEQIVKVAARNEKSNSFATV